MKVRVIDDTRLGRRFRVKADTVHKNAVGVCIRVKRSRLGQTRWLLIELPCGCRCSYAPGELSALALEDRSVAA